MIKGMEKTSINRRNIALSSVLAALISVTAGITIPIGPVPITLQVFFILLILSLAGPKYGTISVLIYILLSNTLCIFSKSDVLTLGCIGRQRR